MEAIGFKISDFEQRLFGEMSPELVKFMFPIERSNCTMWVDPRTKLPILAEGEFEIGKCMVTGFRQTHLKEVNGPIQWGGKIGEKEFLPEPPEGYQQIEMPKEPLSERSIRDLSNRVLRQSNNRPNTMPADARAGVVDPAENSGRVTGGDSVTRDVRLEQGMVKDPPRQGDKLLSRGRRTTLGCTPATDRGRSPRRIRGCTEHRRNGSSSPSPLEDAPRNPDETSLTNAEYGEFPWGQYIC